MKTLMLSILMMVSFSCKKEYKYFVSPQIQPYVKEYLKLMRDNSIKVKDQDFVIIFNSKMPMPNIAGYAYGMFKDDFVLININPMIWSVLNKHQKRTLIFHELSHDLFNTLHTSDVHVMNPQLHNPIISFFNNTKKSDKELIKYIKDGI